MIHYQHTNESRAIFAKAVGVLVRALFFAANNAIHTVRQRKLTFVIVGLLLVLLSAFSVAATNAAGDYVDTPDLEEGVPLPPRVKGLPYGGAEVLQSIFGTMDTKLQSLASSDKLIKFRDAILAAGLSISLLWAGVKTMMAGKGLGELLGEWIPIMLAAGVVMAFTTPGPGSVGNQIVSLMNSIASAITSAVSGSEIDTSSIAKVAQTSVYAAISTILDIVTAPQQSEMKQVEPGSWVTTIVVILFRVFTSGLAAFVIVISMCVYLATAIMAMVSIQLVMALAPVMVPFLVFKPMAWLFDSWLRFLLGACMLKLVGAFMLALTSGFFTQMKVLGQSIANDAKAGVFDSFTGDLILYAMVLMVSVLSGLLMAQVPSIAAGLMSGSAGGAGFSGLRGVTQTLGARTAGAGVAKAANAATRSAKWLGKEAQAQYRGYRVTPAGGPNSKPPSGPPGGGGGKSSSPRTNPMS